MRHAGGPAPRALRVRGPYKETSWLHWLTLSDLMKGYDRHAIVQSARFAPGGRPILLGDLIASEWKDPGPIAMQQRVGTSRSLGPDRRMSGVPAGFDYLLTGQRKDGPAHLRGIPPYTKYPPPHAFRSRYEDGIRDVRLLYPAEFYEKVTGLKPHHLHVDGVDCEAGRGLGVSEDDPRPCITYEGIAWT